MIQLPTNIKPSDKILKSLQKYQDKIVGTFEEKKKLVKGSKSPGFSSRNKKGNKVFDAVKEALTIMCSGAKRCAYCEDAPADEVEHIFPKDLFPDKCFDWDNYLYACGPCNGPKSNQFAVFNGDTTDTLHLDGSTEPPDGQALLVNPRTESGMDFCRLNLSTFHFENMHPQGSREHARAEYTFEQVLRLNTQREYLRQARENAYSNYKSRLFYYVALRDTVSIEQSSRMVQQLQKEAHPTVWKEIVRSHLEGRLQVLDNEFDKLLLDAPEAINW